MSAIRVLVSGAAGNIGYAILPMIVHTVYFSDLLVQWKCFLNESGA